MALRQGSPGVPTAAPSRARYAHWPDERFASESAFTSVEGKVIPEWNVDIVSFLRAHALPQPCVPPSFRGIHRIRSN